MSKTAKATAIIKLLKKGYSPREITERMAVSYNYAWKLKKDLEEAVEDIKTTILSRDADVTFIKPGELVQADTNVDAILNERAANYGRFVDVAEIAQELKDTIRVGETNRSEELPADQREALDMIASKIARVLGGDANYTDSWIDIAGYATLVADRLQGKAR